MDLQKLQQSLQIEFKDTSLLSHSLIHRSYLNENRGDQTSNERLEFLGDAVLELWCSQTLFELFPDFNEGDLTNLRALVVCTPNLAKVSESISLGSFVALSKGEENHGGRKNLSILADTLEAVIGAVYVDQGFKAASAVLSRLLMPSIESLSQQKVYKDPKSLFQEIAQAKKGITPHYQTIEETGPDHSKTFKVGAYIEDELIATGVGPSKQKAEENAAIQAARNLG